jgi:palmitoyltransferase ZDHHC3/7/25
MGRCWWVRTDPCGLFSANFTLMLFLFSYFVIVQMILLPWYGFQYHTVLFTIACILGVISHSRCQYSNPGVIPLVEYKGPKIPKGVHPSHVRSLPRICNKCHVLKPLSAHHCSLCKRCVSRMDHHCPWVNNCVAIFNQKYFILFLFYTGVSAFYAAGLLIARFIGCTGRSNRCRLGGAAVVCSIITFIIALLFGLFVSIMLFDQLSAIYENTPGIDMMQNRKGKKQSFMVSLRNVFGESLSWRWFFPLDMPARTFEMLKDEIEEAHMTRNRVVNDMHEWLRKRHAQEQQQSVQQRKNVVGSGNANAHANGTAGVVGDASSGAWSQEDVDSYVLEHDPHAMDDAYVDNILDDADDLLAHGHSHSHGNHGHSHSHGDHGHSHSHGPGALMHECLYSECAALPQHRVADSDTNES